jgi:hypothetical protein
MDGASHVGATWNKTTHESQGVQQHCTFQVEKYGAETKPPINSDPDTVLHLKTVTDRC